MVSFKGKVSEPIQKELGIKRNTKSGVSGIIITTLLIAPSMFLWLVTLSIIRGKDAIINFDVKPFLAGAVALTATAIVLGFKSIRSLVWPHKKLPPLDTYEYTSSIDENGIKSTGNFASIDLPYKRIKTVFKGEGYFIVYGKKIKRPIVLEANCITEGSFEEAEQLLSAKISEKKHTNKEKLEKTNTYSIVGIVCSSVLVAATIPIILLILSAFVGAISFTVESILVPISSHLWDIMFPFEDTLKNILLGIITFPLFIILSIFIWGPVLLFVCGVFFMVYPTILCCSLVFPLKQLTVNKNKLTKFAIIFSICMIFASIAEVLIYMIALS